MNFFNGLPLFEGDFFPKEPVTFNVWNRTGAALAWGDIVAIPLDFATTQVGLDPADQTDTATGYVFSAAAAVTTQNATRMLAVVQDKNIKNGGTIPDNGLVKVAVWGLVEVKMNGANAGEFLTGTNAAVSATPLTNTELDGLAAPAGIVGIALAATTGVQVGRALWNGLAFSNLVGGGA